MENGNPPFWGDEMKRKTKFSKITRFESNYKHVKDNKNSNDESKINNANTGNHHVKLDLTSNNTTDPEIRQQRLKQRLGEALFPKIHIMQPKLASKITGMILEMDNSMLLNL